MIAFKPNSQLSCFRIYENNINYLNNGAWFNNECTGKE